MLVINRQGKLFLGERKDMPGHFQFPQGGAEPGFTLEENVVRELNEEIGAAPNKLKIIKQLRHVNEYDWDRVPDYAIGKWRGQSQTFWLVRFLGGDADIKLDTHQPEFKSWRWCTLEEVRALTDPRRLKGYSGALKELEEFLQSEN